MSLNNNTIIFTLARMNPPTPGHLFLIQFLIEEAIKKNVPQVYIILSKTNDNKENPISCSEKINVLGEPDDFTKTMIQSLKQKLINETLNVEQKSKIENVKVIPICVPDQKGATPFTPLIPIVANTPNANLILIIGEDRKNLLDSITDFFFKWENVDSVNGIILPREEMQEYKNKSQDPNELDKLNITNVPMNAMSASFVRNIVKNQRRDKFTELYTPYLDNQKIPGLYENILDGTQNLPSNSKPDGPEKPLKYRYPMIKGISELISNTKKRKEGGKKILIKNISKKINRKSKKINRKSKK